MWQQGRPGPSGCRSVEKRGHWVPVESRARWVAASTWMGKQALVGTGYQSLVPTLGRSRVLCDRSCLLCEVFYFIAVACLPHSSTSQFILEGSQAGKQTGEEGVGAMEKAAGWLLPSFHVCSATCVAQLRPNNPEMLFLVSWAFLSQLAI